MNFILKRLRFTPDGIFGELRTEAGDLFCQTLEHAFLSGDGWTPAVPVGTYTCVRGTHQLAGHAQPFETFEVTHVPGHTGILFHKGNWNADSSGCILLGLEAEEKMILESERAFDRFMDLQKGLASFNLVVA
jgi:hypothetical protein